MNFRGKMKFGIIYFKIFIYKMRKLKKKQDERHKQKGLQMVIVLSFYGRFSDSCVP